MTVVVTVIIEQRSFAGAYTLPAGDIEGMQAPRIRIRGTFACGQAASAQRVVYERVAMRRYPEALGHPYSHAAAVSELENGYCYTQRIDFLGVIISDGALWLSVRYAIINGTFKR